MDAALHDGDADSADGAEDELAGVACDGGERPAGDVGVGDGGGVLDLRGEVAEAGAEDDPDDGGERGAGLDVLGGGGGAEVRIWVFCHFPGMKGTPPPSPRSKRLKITNKRG